MQGFVQVNASDLERGTIVHLVHMAGGYSTHGCSSHYSLIVSFSLSPGKGIAEKRGLPLEI